MVCYLAQFFSFRHPLEKTSVVSPRLDNNESAVLASGMSVERFGALPRAGGPVLREPLRLQRA